MIKRWRDMWQLGGCLHFRVAEEIVLALCVVALSHLGFALLMINLNK